MKIMNVDVFDLIKLQKLHYFLQVVFYSF